MPLSGKPFADHAGQPADRPICYNKAGPNDVASSKYNYDTPLGPELGKVGMTINTAESSYPWSLVGRNLSILKNLPIHGVSSAGIYQY